MQVSPENGPPEIYVTWSDPRMTDFENRTFGPVRGARRFTQKDPKEPKGTKKDQKWPKRNLKAPKRRSRWFQTNIKHNYLAS